MPTLLIATHALDFFRGRPYLATQLFPYFAEAGYKVVVHAGSAHLPPADIAWLHVDRTVVPEDYLESLKRYPVVINQATSDIGKKGLSRQLVVSTDSYKGPVIVKTNSNSRGGPEAFHARLFGRAMAALPNYSTFALISAVPDEVWQNPELVVERFLPEQDERGYYVRIWTFLGDREYCVRMLGASPIVKGHGALELTPVPVPDALRARRKELGFDYGKFDFVLPHGEGAPVLLDVNRTPVILGHLTLALEKERRDLATGLRWFLR
jgi:hypothetical protein